MKRTKLFGLITASVFFVAIIFMNGYRKRSFFQGQKDNITNNFYFIISKYPPILHPFSNKFKYQTNIYGSASSGFITDVDSVLFYIDGSEKYLFLDLRKDKKELIGHKKMIPELNVTSDDWYELNFMLPPHSTDKIKGLRLRLTYEHGIDSVIPLLFNDDITQRQAQPYCEYASNL